MGSAEQNGKPASFLPTREEYLAAALNAVDISIFAIRLDTGTITACNQKLCAELEKQEDEIENHHYSDIFWNEFCKKLEKLLNKCTFEKPTTCIYYWAQRLQWVQISVKKVAAPGGISLAIVSLANITDIGRSEYEHHRLAFYDQLLSIPNERQLEQDVASLEEYESAALLHFEINHFYAINDVYGADSGDFLLEQVRDWLLATSAENSRLYRINYDEFSILIQDIDLERAQQRARQILHRFTQPWQSAQRLLDLYCTISLGIIYGPYLEGDIHNLLFRTISGNTKPGSFTLYSADMDREYKQKLLMRQALINCLLENMKGFSVAYQPIVHAGNGSWAGLEALCRWVSPEFGPISPTVFIPELEQLGLIDQLDTWVTRTAVRQCTEWGLSGKNFFLDVNFSPLQMVNHWFASSLQSLLEEYSFPANKLYLEITESNRFDFSDENLAVLGTLQNLGVHISLDDFGTGYSTFQTLMRLPAQVLKTEKSFIENLENDTYRQHLVRMMVTLAHTASMKIICEGVETDAQRQLLVSYGADFFQGYLFSRPLNEAQLVQNLYRFQ